MINIISAKTKDLPTIQKLNYEIFIDNQHYDNDLVMNWSITKPGKKYFSKLLSDSTIKSKACCFIAYDKQKPVGYIAARRKDIDYRKSKSLEIENMGVSPQYQSKGIGTILIKKAFSWAKQNGYQKAYVNSYFKNTGAIKFYKKSGFLEIDLVLVLDL